MKIRNWLKRQPKKEAVTWVSVSVPKTETITLHDGTQMQIAVTKEMLQNIPVKVPNLDLEQVVIGQVVEVKEFPNNFELLVKLEQKDDRI